MVSTSFSNRHPPLYAPLSDLSVCNAFGVSVCLFYPIQAGAMASLADLAAATEELSEEVRCIFQPRCLVKPADLYTPRLLPLMHQGAPAASLGKTHPTHGATISHLCLFHPFCSPDLRLTAAGRAKAATLLSSLKSASRDS